MRWIRYSKDGKTSYGILDGEQITEVLGDPFAGYEKTQRKHALGSVKIELPCEPRTFYCAGMNYVAHVTAMAKRRNAEPKFPEKPDVGYRANNALCAHDEPVIIPSDATELVHYEGELVVVIGRKARHLTMANAMDCVLGYTIGNDVSERTWFRADRTMWRSKNPDSWKPMGPWIETDVDLDTMETIIRVNGSETSRFATNGMVFGIAEHLVAMTRYITLQPGDVLWMGTDGTSPNLKAGDVVEIELTGIGTLRNRFEAEQPF